MAAASPYEHGQISAIVDHTGDPRMPRVIRFMGVPLEALICRRKTLEANRGVTADWDTSGVYVLVGPNAGNPEGPAIRVYAGETEGLLNRMVKHIEKKDWWHTAVLIRRPTRPGAEAPHHGALEPTEIEYLQMLLHTALDDAVGVEREGNFEAAVADLSLAAELGKRYFPAVRMAVDLAGVPLETAEDLERLEELQPTIRGGGT